jgi:hypothetical protein
MLSLNDILIVLGSVLAIIVALHAYAQWSIRNIDRNNDTEADLAARSGDMAAAPVRAQDVRRRHR